METGPLVLLAFGGCFALLVSVLELRARTFPNERIFLWSALAVTLLGAGAATTALLFFEVPNDWVTPLQEGLTLKAVEVLYGRAAHVGPLYAELVRLLADEGPAPAALRGLIRMNLVLTATSALVFAGLTWAICRRWLAVAFFLGVYLTSPHVKHGAVSELASPLIVLLLLAAFIGAATFQQLPEGRARLVPLGLLTVATVLAALCRMETAVLGVPAIAYAALRHYLGDETTNRLSQPVRALVGRIVRLPLPVHVAGLLLSMHLLSFHVGTPQITHGFHGLLPWNPSITTLPMTLAHAMPLSAVALVLLGLIHAFRHTASFLFLPVSVVVLYRTYIDGSHGTWDSVIHELFRYSTVFAPVMMVVALFGWRELEGFATRHAWAPTWRRYALLALLFMTVGGPPTGHREALYGHYSEEDTEQQVGLLSRDHQREVRYLLDALDERPECVVLTRVIGKHRGGGRGLGPATNVLFGGHLRNPRELPPSTEPLASQIVKAEPRTRCARVYRGLDCHHEDMSGCNVLAAGLTLESELHLRHLPYVSVDEYGTFRPNLRLAFYDLPLRGPKPPESPSQSPPSQSPLSGSPPSEAPSQWPPAPVAGSGEP